MGPASLARCSKLRPRAAIESLDHAYGTGCRSRVLSRWSSFGPLVFAQLAGRHRLRDVVTTMASPSTARAPRPDAAQALHALRPSPSGPRRCTNLLATRCPLPGIRTGAWLPVQQPAHLFGPHHHRPRRACSPRPVSAAPRGPAGPHAAGSRGDIPAFVVLTPGEPSAITVACDGSQGQPRHHGSGVTSTSGSAAA